jgi:hypothetical protein
MIHLVPPTPDPAVPTTLIIDQPGHEFHGREVTHVNSTKNGSAMVHVYDHVYALVAMACLRAGPVGAACL